MSPHVFIIVVVVQCVIHRITKLTQTVTKQTIFIPQISSNVDSNDVAVRQYTNTLLHERDRMEIN